MLEFPEGLDHIGDYIASLGRCARGDTRDHDEAAIDGLLDRAGRSVLKVTPTRVREVAFGLPNTPRYNRMLAVTLARLNDRLREG